LDLWLQLETIKQISESASPKHLLWALMFAKVYASKEVHTQVVGKVGGKRPSAN
jgi:hypothetical protein